MINNNKPVKKGGRWFLKYEKKNIFVCSPSSSFPFNISTASFRHEPYTNRRKNNNNNKTQIIKQYYLKQLLHNQKYNKNTQGAFRCIFSVISYICFKYRNALVKLLLYSNRCVAFFFPFETAKMIIRFTQNPKYFGLLKEKKS